MWSSEQFSSAEDMLQLYLKGHCEEGYWVLWGYDENGAEKQLHRETISGDFEVSYTFDPVSLGVYEKAVSFKVSVYGNCTVEKWQLQVPERDTSVSVEKNVAVKDGVVPVLQEDGKEIQVSTIPKKVLFVGNSILLGMFNTYGMCATDACHDYAYIVSQEILKRSPDCAFSKLHGSAFEHSESRDAFERWFYTDPNMYTKKPAADSFTEDLDLITLQIMDNVNTHDKVTAFRENMPELLRQIKHRCPRARIVWIYGWYRKPQIVEFIQDTCKKWKIEIVDVTSAHSKQNESYSGQISIDPDGNQIVVKDTWITHPGNSGMAAIAEKILQTLFPDN